MKKNRKKRISAMISLVLAFTMLFGTGSVFAEDSVNIMVYPIRPNSTEWNEFTTHEEKLNACQIPNDILTDMSINELIEAILKYPLLIDIYAFDTLQDGLVCVTKNFNGLQELSMREDKVEKLIEKYNAIPVVSSFSGSENVQRVFGLTFLETLLSSFDNLECMTSNQIQLFEASVFEKYQKRIENLNIYGSFASPLYSSLIGSSNNNIVKSNDIFCTIKTPAGTSVPVVFRSAEYDSNYIAQLNAEIASVYPRAIRYASASRKYNCHAYAWDSLSSIYWMDNPSAYMSDGSYTKKFNPVPGDKVYYVDGDHSAIYAQSGYIFKSKWGYGGVYLHRYDDCPYNSSRLNYYSR